MRLFYKLSHWYFTKNALPYWCVFVFDCFVVITSGLICHTLIWGATATANGFVPLLETLLFYLIFYIIGFRIFHTYSGVMRYTSFADIHRIALANLTGVLSIGILRHFFMYDMYFVPIRLRELAMSFVLATAVMWTARMIVKYMYEFYKQDQDARGVFIYGVKTGGMSIARALLDAPNVAYRLRGFVSDANDMTGKMLMGVRVYRNDKDLLKIMEREKANALFVSPLKKEDFIKQTALVDMLIEKGISIFMMPSATEWDGKSDIFASQLHEIEIEDLLPRDEINIDFDAVRALLKGKRILITGSAGSIGSEIVKQIAGFHPSQLILIDQAETPQHDIRLMLRNDFPEVKAETIVTTICNRGRMETIFNQYRPDYVFHAAAYKHVPMMEDNPCESVQNNIEGTRIIADISVKYGVKKFVMISTDKAVNPTNVMGCSKRICEIYVQSLDRAIKEGKVNGVTQFVTTRFGNVLGSNGSVIPIFREQIRHGGPVTVTHPEILRYFMLIPEACKLVLEAGTMGKGGEVFVFDMGAPVKIVDLAKRMIKLSGAQNIDIEYTGLRDGEKLYEEVLNEEEITIPTINKKIRVAKVREYDIDTVKKQISQLVADSYAFDNMLTVKQMKQIVPEYKSNHSVYESLDK
ncbi:MAG: nucleoside-diphosphate sugar epimerase/dehydratase [Prevotella sp.]|uniref:polysaccharide biosynthesis protein n=1 Tax=Prevotella sp. TaxID=59823 RepID=UPI002A31BA28|nr:nucleoside-diphosphate sugar epimerase/dehydratase [Prevotella sp.]MDD7317449.1 nucleoside-diphosphate sugar epimerase/dehydratase [Prevotellaceae bacterium]MDY4019215.1 nucleoside-diphosphate sugar epimerase/dehydratase [Prevotella sp.]